MESSKWRRMSMLPSSEPPSITINSMCSSRNAMMLSSSEGSSCRARKTTLMMETSGGTARAPPRKRRPPSMRVAVGSVKLTLCIMHARFNAEQGLASLSAGFSNISSLAQELAAWCSIIEAGGAVQGNLVEIAIFGAGGFAREVEWLIAEKNAHSPTATVCFVGRGDEVGREIHGIAVLTAPEV